MSNLYINKNSNDLYYVFALHRNGSSEVKSKRRGSAAGSTQSINDVIIIRWAGKALLIHVIQCTEYIRDTLSKRKIIIYILTYIEALKAWKQILLNSSSMNETIYQLLARAPSFSLLPDQITIDGWRFSRRTCEKKYIPNQ